MRIIFVAGVLLLAGIPGVAWADDQGPGSGPVAVDSAASAVEVAEPAAPGCHGEALCQDWVMPKHLARTIFLFGNLGASSYAMGDVNSWMDEQNAAHGVSLRGIHGGANANFGAGVWFTDHLAGGVEFGSLNARSSARKDGFRETLNLPASEAGIFGRIGNLFWDRLILSASVGAGVLSLSGASLTEYNQQTAPFSYSLARLYGTALDLKAYGSAEIMVSRHVGLGLDVGYRRARIENQQERMDHQRAFLADDAGSRVAIDYSGVFADTGIRIYFR